MSYDSIGCVMGQTRRSRRTTQRPITGEDPFWDLVATARRLQAPGGCPWDRAQTVESLMPYLVEETWEVFDAVRARRRRAFQEELGDVLYSVLFLTLVGQRHGWCDLATLLRVTREKMVRRHPHVFGARRATTPREAYAYWQAVKRTERSSPSRSKRLRPLLIAVWESVRKDPQMADTLERFLRERPSGLSRRPSARRGRTTAQ